MTHETLDNLWVRTHHRLLMLATGATGKYDPRVDPTESDWPIPKDFGNDITYLEDCWEKAQSRKAKRSVIEEALALVFRHSPPATKRAALPYMPAQSRDSYRKETFNRDLLAQRDAKTVEWRMAVAADKDRLDIVSRRWGVPVMAVRRWRAEFPHAGKENGNGHRKQSEVSRSTYQFLRDQIKMVDFLGDRDKPYGDR